MSAPMKLIKKTSVIEVVEAEVTPMARPEPGGVKLRSTF
jgi:hypothetical protein